MLTHATAFDYSGEDRAKLFRLGDWVDACLSKRSCEDLQELATSFTGNRYEDLMGLARLLKFPGPRLVIYEDKAMQLGFLVMRLLQDEKESYAGHIGRLASPILDDMQSFVEIAKKQPNMPLTSP